MAFIKLNTRDWPDAPGHSILVNPDRITYMAPNSTVHSEAGTVIRYSGHDDDYHVVKESFDTIVAILQRMGCTIG